MVLTILLGQKLKNILQGAAKKLIRLYKDNF